MFAKIEKIFHIIIHNDFRGGYMFKIFTFRQLAILSFFICMIMLIGALLNALSPVVKAHTEEGIKVPVIMYHHICNSSSLWGDYVIPQSLLEEDFLYLKENGITPVSIKDLKSFITDGKKLPDKPVIISFDDGHKSFITKVVPLLEKYNYPANVNIVGSLVELYTQNCDNNDCYAYLNAEDIKALSKNPLVEIGCHTYNLHSLSARRGASRKKGESDSDYKNVILNDIEAFDSLYFEISQNKTDIFAYPYGIKNKFLSQIIDEQGFSVTLSCRESVNVLKQGSSLQDLGRFNRPYGISSQYFFRKMF